MGTSLVDALVAVGLVESRNAARRVIGEGGASVNGEKVADLERVSAPTTCSTARSSCSAGAARTSPRDGPAPAPEGPARPAGTVDLVAAHLLV